MKAKGRASRRWQLLVMKAISQKHPEILMGSFVIQKQGSCALECQSIYMNATCRLLDNGVVCKVSKHFSFNSVNGTHWATLSMPRAQQYIKLFKILYMQIVSF